MGNKLDLSFDILQTTLRVIYGDIAQLDTGADVVVSTDDTYLSASSGVSKRIWDKAEKPRRQSRERKLPMLRREVRKFSLPLPAGSVVVTSAGYMKAKYIFHAAVLDLNSRSDPQFVISSIVRHVLELANALSLESIVTPILVTQRTRSSGEQVIVSELTGLPEVEVVDIILRTLARYLAQLRSPISVRKITIAMHDDDVDDHIVAEQRLFADLAAVRNDVANWVAKVTPINAWMVHVLPLLGTVVSSDQRDASLLELLETRLRSGQEELCGLFGGEATCSSHIRVNNEDGPSSQEEYDRFHQRLMSKLTEADEDRKHFEKLRTIARNNMHILEEQKASLQPSPPIGLLNQLNESKKDFDTAQHDFEEAERDYSAAQQGLEMLESRWHGRQTPQLSSHSAFYEAPQRLAVPGAVETA
jgi:O-acetyl-ADP-ribose deacetylase (regulator of RNase III)